MGDYESICGFGALGLDIFSASGAEETKRIFKRLCGEDYVVIYITEALAKEIKEEIKKIEELLLPSVVLIPGLLGNTGEAMENIRAFTVKAVGSDTVFKD